MLIVFWMSHVGVILGLNEGIGRQLTALAVSLKLPIEVKMIGQKKQLQQRMSLRDIVEIDLPVSDARLLEAVVYIGLAWSNKRLIPSSVHLFSRRAEEIGPRDGPRRTGPQDLRGGFVAVDA
jgi:hypothetical protein